MELDAKIEALLFFKGEPVAIKKIAEILEVTTEEVLTSLTTLSNKKEGTGLTVVVVSESEATLGTNKEASIFLEKLRKDEITKELSKATLETLSIILYKNGPNKNGVTRNEIDYIRGVNSSFILRNLLIRGLIEKKVDIKDSRRFIYTPTIELLEFMGISDITMLPKYKEVVEELEKAITNEENTINE
jgi:segregation and condensation protein B